MKPAIIACLLLCFARRLPADNPLKDNSSTMKTKRLVIKTHKRHEFQIATYKEKQTKKFHLKKKLRVKTCLNDRYGITVGLQTIYLGKKAISESQKVSSEKHGKTTYVVHSHPYMTVYSSDDTQYILLKN